MDYAALLDSNCPLEQWLQLLEQVISVFYGARSPEERSAADKVLTQLKEHPDTWTRVDAVLQKSTNTPTRFFALQILEDVCRFKWGALPMEQREGIRNFVTDLIVKISTDESSFTSERTLLNKLDVVLVQILKHDWPAKWPNFIPDLVQASQRSETLCENSMQILKLLSEEIFDFSRDEMVQAKTKQLKAQLNTEFKAIHELCVFVMQASRRPTLLQATLTALHSYLGWVPLMYVFDSALVELLLGLFPEPAFRNSALKCLTEVGGLSVSEEYDNYFVQLYTVFVNTLASKVIPPGINIAQAYESGSDEDQAFVANLALFLTSFFRSHLAALEARLPDTQGLVLQGLDLLLQVSYVDDQEVFKTCLEFWRKFAHDLYMRECCGNGGAGPAGVPGVPGMAPGSPFPVPGGMPRGPGATSGFWQDLYRPVLRALRLLMIQRMAKPEEVIVVVDENGNVVREVLSNAKDHLDVLQQHKVMQDTLKYLTYLDYQETHALMLEKLQLQLSGAEWGWERLNTLCWAVGAIAGTVTEDEAENKFLVTVIKDLLVLCEKTRGKDNKAVIASNIMYVVGQYPRFLNNHWKFLKTVVYKLFEFMHELHPGVQDMACDTFLKIVQRCTRRFVTMQPHEQDLFVRELLFSETVLPDMSRVPKFQEVMSDLEAGQRQRFYEGVALMIQAVLDEGQVPRMLAKLMEPANLLWGQVLSAAKADAAVLRDPEATKRIVEVLNLNVAACSSLGAKFLPQLEAIYPDMLALYQGYSVAIQDTIRDAISRGVPAEHAARYSVVRNMRGGKRAVLRLVESFADRCEPAERHLLLPLFPPLVQPVLVDFQTAEPEEIKEPDVLGALAAVINRLGDLFQPFVAATLSSTFDVTLGMITRNMEEYPEHRLKFFAMIRAVTSNCFSVLFEMSPQQLKLVLDSIIWAFRHTERNVAEVGLNLLHEMLLRFADSPLCTDFQRGYYMTLVREVLTVLTDTFHKPGFKLHVKILHHLFTLVQDTGRICRPLWDTDGSGPGANPPPVPGPAPSSNAEYVKGHVGQYLAASFPNMTPIQIGACVEGMFEMRDYAAFKQHIRDFLVQTKEFSDQDNAQLYAEEVGQRKQEQQAIMAGQLAQGAGMTAGMPGEPSGSGAVMGSQGNWFGA